LFNSGRRLAAGAATRPNEKYLVLQFEFRVFMDLPAFIDPLANGRVAPKPVMPRDGVLPLQRCLEWSHGQRSAPLPDARG
jgi:hypothetical protein